MIYITVNIDFAKNNISPRNTYKKYSHYHINNTQYPHNMSATAHSTTGQTQNDLLMKNLMDFYNNRDNLIKMMNIINGESPISLRIVDWFVTNFAKKYYTVYTLIRPTDDTSSNHQRFKVYNEYKLRLKAYSKKRFDPFCRWERISVPYDADNYMETTIGQLNFFKWAIETQVIGYIEENYKEIENDMNSRNSTSKRKMPAVSTNLANTVITDNAKTRKKREELSISACKCIKKEDVKIVISFN